MDIYDDFLTVNRAAHILGISHETLKRWEKTGKVTVSRDPITNARIYNPEEIEAIRFKTFGDIHFDPLPEDEPAPEPNA